MMKKVEPSYISADIDTLTLDSTYHLYLGNPCPWCHRIYFALEILKSPISTTKLIDNPEKASKGGWFIDSKLSPDPMNQVDLAGVYSYCTTGKYQGRCTVLHC